MARKRNKNVSITIRLPQNMIDKLDNLVDGCLVKDRSQIVFLVINKWIVNGMDTNGLFTIQKNNVYQNTNSVIDSEEEGIEDNPHMQIVAGDHRRRPCLGEGQADPDCLPERGHIQNKRSHGS